MTPPLASLLLVFCWFLFGYYSFGGNVRVPASVHSRVVLTSFGGTIEVPNAPRGASLRSFGGEIRVGDAEGRVEATSFGGEIDVASLAGSARLLSFGGDVDVAIVDAESDARRIIKVRSYGGDVVVRLPHDFDATVDIVTRCKPGREDECGVQSDIALARTRQRVYTLGTLFRGREETHATGRIGDGRHKLLLRLDEGTVALHRD